MGHCLKSPPPHEDIILAIAVALMLSAMVFHYVNQKLGHLQA